MIPWVKAMNAAPSMQAKFIPDIGSNPLPQSTAVFHTWPPFPFPPSPLVMGSHKSAYSGQKYDRYHREEEKEEGSSGGGYLSTETLLQ